MTSIIAFLLALLAASLLAQIPIAATLLLAYGLLLWLRRRALRSRRDVASRIWTTFVAQAVIWTASLVASIWIFVELCRWCYDFILPLIGG